MAKKKTSLPAELPAVPTFETVCARLSLPPEAAETLDDAVRLQAETLSPFEEGTYTFAHEVLRRRPEGIDILVAAAANETLDAFGHDRLAAAGLLGTVRLDLTALAWVRGLTERHPGLAVGVRPVLLRAPTEQLLAVLADGVPVALHAFPPELDDAALTRQATLLLARLGMSAEVGEMGMGFCCAAEPAAAEPLREALGADPEFAPIGDAEALLQRGLHLRAEAGATFDLTPQAWRDEARATRQKRLLVAGGSVFGAAWLLCALFLFLMPKVYGKLARDVGDELNAGHAAYMEVLALRDRVDLIRRYEDHSRSALEMLRLICQEKASNVILLTFTYNRDSAVRITGLADDTSDVYGLKNALQGDKGPDGEPRIAAVNINRLTLDPKTRRQRFDIEILFPVAPEEEQ